MNEVPLKRIAMIRPSSVDKKSRDDELPVRLCNYTDVYYNETITPDLPFMAATASSEQLGAFQLRHGDVIITKDSETEDDIGIAAFVDSPPAGLVCGYHLTLIRPDTASVSPRFLFWTLSSAYVRNFWGSMASGVTRVGLRSDAVGSLPVQLPSPSVQVAMAEFLDAETGRIDWLIARKRQLLSRIDEYIDAQIRLQIGRSSLAGGPESAVELRRILAPVHREVAAGAGMVTAYRDGQVILRSERRAEGYTESWTDSSNVRGVAVDDVVIHGLDGFAGAIGASESAGACSPVYHVCRPIDGDPFYLARMLRVLALEGYLELFATSTRQRAVDLRNWELLGRIPVPAVPLEEQRQIGRRLRKLRPLRRAIAKSEALAQERRRALITAVVTENYRMPGVGV